MGQRPTRRAGIAKFRVTDPATQKVLDAVIERIEVLDGLRGDSLDKAVTYRDLGLSGFTVISGSGGTQQITNTPGSGTDGGGVPIPGIGSAAAPENLAAAETFLALLLTWNNPSFNLQHIEVWRSATDNLSTALLLGTTVSPQFMDYVGSNTSYFYWVRSVGTDGTYSAYNDTVGTEGTTGIDPSAISIPGGGFVIQDPGAGPDIAPFIVGTVNGETAVGLSGQFIVDGTIRANHIVAGAIGAGHIDVETLSAISGNMGVLRTGRITTGLDGNPPLYDDQSAFRVEIQSQDATAYPLWYGSGAKGDTTGLFYVDKNGRVVVKGILDASMIKQSYFAPPYPVDNNSFRIATQYVDDGTPGANYTGKLAHLIPMLGTTQATAVSLYNATTADTPYTSPSVMFQGPESSSIIEYGRLGTNSELLQISLNATTSIFGDEEGPWDSSPGAPTYYIPFMAKTEVHLEYRYSDDASWSHLTILPMLSAGTGTTTFQMTVSTRNTSFEWIAFRYRVVPLQWRAFYIGNWHSAASTYTPAPDWYLENSSLAVTTANFGYADATLALLTPVETGDSPLTAEELETRAGGGFVQLP